ncbi:DUF7079 family protein [Alcaligenes aquatilis]|uniref:DUF7079 family protein n=1 Tax=Alcaligenes aquatilis TaxID=323284 RepID=UPI00360C5D1D
MGDRPSDKQLCEALSELFVDRPVNYQAIANVAKHFSVHHVERALFEWVAPVCYSNALAPIPSIWTGFEPDQLWRDIVAHRQACVTAGWFGRVRGYTQTRFLRYYFANEWRELSQYLPSGNPPIFNDR